ncbi:di-N-acetylchitobiase-like [Glandiceps talaboti]
MVVSSIVFHATLVCSVVFFVVSVNLAAKCPCSDVSLCKPLTTAPRKEVFIFRTGGSTWKHYDWSKITTVASFGEYDPQLMCTAHAHGARLVQAGGFPVSNLTNKDDWDKWINSQLSLVKNRFMDGINIDTEDVLIDPKSRNLLTELVNKTTHVFHEHIPGSQVTFDIAWTQKCYDQGFRCYDYKGLADVTDFLFVMDYDEMGGIKETCVADANSPINKTISGMEDYIKSGISPDKLVLGVPWYGYDYPCQNLTKNTCVIEHKPFWPVCDENVGTEKNYAVIMKLLANNATSGRLWNDEKKSPFFNYKDISTNSVHQIWYDDPESLKYKYDYVLNRKLRGVGSWHGDSLDYSNDPSAIQQTKAMWDALPALHNV